MKRDHVDSSVISSIGYDENKHVLEVKFISSGELYQYFDVPKKEYKKLIQLSKNHYSVGAYFNSEFKNKYKRFKLIH